ncbi:recombinase family protein [Trueperella pecoris]|uniref:recombinase family protein n=1 Tax=Trueperella pecoris TaxID=2733571 RepID=UPI0021004894|nr:recombinase family protein [Trueperella pecoris]
MKRPEMKGFTVKTLGELIKQGLILKKAGHGSPSADRRGGHISYIKVSDIRAGQVNINPSNLVPTIVAEKFWRGSSSGLKAFDLITPIRASKNIGEFAVLMPGQEEVVLTKEMLILRAAPKAPVDNFYLLWALSLRVVRQQWDRVVLMQTNREDVGLRYLEIEIPWPDTEDRGAEVSVAFRDYYRGIDALRQTFLNHLENGGAASRVPRNDGRRRAGPPQRGRRGGLTMLVGYARVSTSLQGESLKTQREALVAAGCDPQRVYIDEISGTMWSRPELVKALALMGEGDTLVVTRLDRLGRNVRETILTIADLGARGINVRVLEPHIDTADPMNKGAFIIMSALAEWDRDLMVARTKEGVANARAEGRVAGPKPKLSSEQIRLVRQAVTGGESVASVARSFDVSRQTVYRALERIAK